MDVTTHPDFHDCSALAFYGVAAEPDAAARFYQLVLRRFGGWGYPPDHLSVGRSGRPGKLAAFAPGDAKLRKLGFGDVDSFEVVAALPDARTLSHGYYVTAGLNRAPKRLVASIVARTAIARLGPGSLLDTAREAVEILGPVYGIGLRQAHARGPEFYVLGVNYGSQDAFSGAAYEEEVNVSRWSNVGMSERIYDRGLLRDVYPWNFLTAPALERDIGGRPLRAWITADAARGTLEPFAGDSWLWSVPDDAIPRVRGELLAADAIFEWRRFLAARGA